MLSYPGAFHDPFTMTLRDLRFSGGAGTALPTFYAIAKPQGRVEQWYLVTLPL
jgi:hypothetical protein